MNQALREAHERQAKLANDLYRVLGHALSQWSALEEALCSTYILSACPHHQTQRSPAGAAFWAVTAFADKLKISHAAVSVWARDKENLSIEWRALYDELRKQDSERRDLTHGTVTTYWHGEIGETFFAPSHLRAIYTADVGGAADDAQLIPSEGRLSRSDIEQRTAGYTEISKRLRSFRTVLYFHLAERGAVGLPAGEASPPPRTETIPYGATSPPPPEPLQE
jgi:hypothetical protein